MKQFESYKKLKRLKNNIKQTNRDDVEKTDFKLGSKKVYQINEKDNKTKWNGNQNAQLGSRDMLILGKSN